MQNEINKPRRAFNGLINRMDRQRANEARTRRPRGFWTQVVYDYIVVNPGTSKAAASRSIEPHRSSQLGLKIIAHLIEKEWIIWRDRGLYVVGKSGDINKETWDDLY